MVDDHKLAALIGWALLLGALCGAILVMALMQGR